MTILGKILVFVILVISLVNGAMVIFVYVARTNYVTELKKEKDYRQLDKANAEAYRQQVEDVRAELQPKVDQGTQMIKRQQEDLLALQALIVRQREQIAAEVEKTNRADAIAKAATAEVDRRQTDMETIRKTLKEEMDKNIKLVNETNSYKARTTGAEIESNSFRERNRELVAQLEAMARDLARQRASGGPTTTVARTGKNPPTENIEGKVMETDRGGLIKVSLGSDAGLARDNTLEVFRLNRNNPSLSKYLGTIRIIRIGQTEAVGEPMGRLAGPIQPGDTVASRIGG
jgi:hypothetical protein